MVHTSVGRGCVLETTLDCVWLMACDEFCISDLAYTGLKEACTKYRRCAWKPLIRYKPYTLAGLASVRFTLVSEPFVHLRPMVLIRLVRHLR